MSLYDMVDNVRSNKLGGPRANAPDDGAILDKVCFHTRSTKRFRRATGNPWDFNDLIVQVVPGTDTYQITATDFAQSLAVITHDPSNPSWIPRLVRIFEPQNLIYNIPTLPAQWASYAYVPWDGSNCTAQRAAFYWRDNNPYIQLWPTPQLSAQYKVRYLQNTASVDNAALASEPAHQEDIDLIEIRSALSLLAIAEWWDGSTKEGRAANAEKRRDLMMTLKADEQEAFALFEALVRTPTGPRLYRRVDFTVG